MGASQSLTLYGPKPRGKKTVGKEIYQEDEERHEVQGVCVNTKLEATQHESSYVNRSDQ